jgi:hypothetical protein
MGRILLRIVPVFFFCVRPPPGPLDRSRVPGVRRHRRRWTARVWRDGAWHHIGSYATEAEAERAARRARLWPDPPPEEPPAAAA